MPAIVHIARIGIQCARSQYCGKMFLLEAPAFDQLICILDAKVRDDSRTLRRMLAIALTPLRIYADNRRRSR
jgi:hypothetical protein